MTSTGGTLLWPQVSDEDVNKLSSMISKFQCKTVDYEMYCSFVFELWTCLSTTYNLDLEKLLTNLCAGSSPATLCVLGRKKVAAVQQQGLTVLMNITVM